MTDTARREPSVGQVLDAYLADRRGRVAAFRRLEHAAKPLRRLLARRGALPGEEDQPDEARPASDIRPKLCRAYAAARRAEGIGDGTIGRELAALRAALRLAFEDEELAALPVVKLPPAPKPRERWLTRDEAARLIAAAHGHLRLFIVLALHTGARSCAILALSWGRVDLAARLIDFRQPGKPVSNKQAAVVPANETAAAALAAARPADVGADAPVICFRGRRVRSVLAGVKRAADRAGLEGVTPHVLRHSTATWLDRAGVDEAKVAGVLGHRSAKITRAVYIHRDAALEAEKLRAAVARLEAANDDRPQERGDPTAQQPASGDAGGGPTIAPEAA